MSFYNKHLFAINDIIEKAILNTKKHCEKFAQQLFTDLSKDRSDDEIKIFHNGLTHLTNISNKGFDQKLLQATQSLKNLSQRNTESHNQSIDPSAESQPLQTIVVKREREKQYDQEIDHQWKEMRSNFFNHTIIQKLNQFQVQHQHQIQIIQLFRQAKQDYSSRRLLLSEPNKKGEFQKYQKEIQQLNQSLKLINQQFFRRQKQTHVINQIIRAKFTQLKLIRIQYNLSIYYQHRYQVSAFQLFKVISENRGLFQVTIKGVKVKEFNKFVRALAQSRLNQKNKSRNEQCSWMKNFRPLNPLKLAIDAQADFYLSNNEDDICAINDLAQFGEMFQQLSLISVKIQLEEYRQSKQVRDSLQASLKQLKMMRNIKIKIKIEGYVFEDQPFTVAIQMLSSLTTITQVQFKDITLISDVSINHFLAMEQILSSIFENNTVTRLQLFNCRNLPIIPKIPTLQTIYFYRISFRKQFSFIGRNSPSLLSIAYIDIPYQLRIEEQQFNQLQSLSIQYCQSVNLVISPHSPSNIKYLIIRGSNIGRVDDLSVLFPKLAHLTSLSLYLIDFQHQLLCTIPSPHLQFLQMRKNNEFAGKGLEVIDKKWPKLRLLSLRDFSQLNDEGWGACEFKGLIKLWIDTKILARGHRIRQQLRGRGILVYQ